MNLLIYGSEESAMHSYEHWFEALKPKIMEHFDIECSDFFIFTENSFVPMQGHRSATKRNQSISVDLLTGGAYEQLYPVLQEKGFDYADEIPHF